MRRLTALVVALAVCGALAGTSGAGRSAFGVPRWTHWLCLPGRTPDYCRANLTTTFVTADGRRHLLPVGIPKQRPIDCFYVYPTVSGEHRGNADLRIQAAQKQVALVQAAPFEPVCRVFAPVYRQATAYGRTLGGNVGLGYEDVLAAWRDYVAHYNDGRGVVLIGHSQGAFVLKVLLRQEIEPSPAERRLLVSAILAGGNVLVPDRSPTGADFARTPPCRTATQTGCVVAWSSWDRTPPADASFERVDRPGRHVLCVNPAAPAGGRAAITPLFVQQASQGLTPAPLYPTIATLWVAFPDRYVARCVRKGSRAWLLVTPATTHDRRPVVRELEGPRVGLGDADLTLVLANLVNLVASEARAWKASH
jgi:hypothetical protein